MPEANFALSAGAIVARVTPIAPYVVYVCRFEIIIAIGYTTVLGVIT
jgi:hypothetical protein